MKSIYERGADHGGDVPGHHRLQINGLQQSQSGQLRFVRRVLQDEPAA